MDLRIVQVSKQYGRDRRGLRQVTLTLHSGIGELVGPNGAGKSSLMRTRATVPLSVAGAIILLLVPAVVGRRRHESPRSQGAGWSGRHDLPRAGPKQLVIGICKGGSCLMEPDITQARRGLVVFLTLVVLGTVPLQGYIIVSGLPFEQIFWLVPIIMWVPAVAAVITRLALREGFGDVSFRLGGRQGLKALGLALLFPVLVGAIAYGIAWATGLATLADARGGLIPALTDPIANPLLRLAVRLVLALIPGALIGLITAVGEELGWRGYMLSRLVAARVPQPLVVSGLIWTLWHLGAILSGQYPDMGPNRLLSALGAGVTFVGLSILWGNLRLTTGSFWPAAIGHSAWNMVIPLFTAFTVGGVGRWLGETSLLVAAITLGLALLLSRVWLGAGGRRQNARGLYASSKHG